MRVGLNVSTQVGRESSCLKFDLMVKSILTDQPLIMLLSHRPNVVNCCLSIYNALVVSHGFIYTVGVTVPRSP